MERIRNVVFLCLLGALFFEVLVVFPGHVGKQNDESAEEKVLPPQGGADQKMSGIHLVESQRGSRDWELFAEAAEGSQNQGAWDLKAVRVLFYNKDRTEFTVTGDEGSIDNNSKNMRVRGNVTTTSMNGYVFRTEEISYDALKRIIISPGAVSMLGPEDSDGAGLKVRGRSMKVEVDESRMTIQNQVSAEKQVSGGRFLRIQSRSAAFSGRGREALFKGEVVMQYDQTRLESPEAAFSSKEGHFLADVKLKGGVKVSDKDKFATSENLNLDLIANQFVFSGRPKVFQNEDELSGDRIIFLEGGKKVKVEKVRAKVENEKQR